MNKLLAQPLNVELIMEKKKSIKRELLGEKCTSIDLRIAILGGSTTSEIKSILELFLLDRGIRPSFYESEYNKWYEDSVFENQELTTFKPQLVYVHTSFTDLIDLPQIDDDKNTIEKLVHQYLQKYINVWQHLEQQYNCIVVQNNFELPFCRPFGNLDFSMPTGTTAFVNSLNSKFAAYAQTHKNFYINDINYLAAQVGLNNWYDRDFYNLYKFAMSYDAIPYLAYNLAVIIGAAMGKSKKCLVLDLDNTLWGGVIGDDGLAGIQLGHETAVGEAYLEFQKYVLALKKRGVILAVCSKNDERIAKSGFDHPDSILKVHDFAAFITNWEPKHLNLIKVAQEINIGLDSLVFIDDNPTEREIVRANLPEVLVPEVEGGSPSTYVRALEDGKYFEQVAISADDLKRNQTYQENRQRLELEKSFISYADFLKSLKMKAEIKPFASIYLDRITQLTNKTNQFNLTTKRYTRGEIDDIATSEEYITLYGRLSDKFGDNGLVSVIIGKIEGQKLHINLWLMSCRVLKRDFEFAMFKELVGLAKSKGIKEIYGYYYPTLKNAMVKDFFAKLNFIKKDCDSVGNSIWLLDIVKLNINKDIYIDIKNGGEKLI